MISITCHVRGDKRGCFDSVQTIVTVIAAAVDRTAVRAASAPSNAFAFDAFTMVRAAGQPRRQGAAGGCSAWAAVRPASGRCATGRLRGNRRTLIALDQLALDGSGKSARALRTATVSTPGGYPPSPAISEGGRGQAFFPAGAIGELRARDFVPRPEQHRVDAGTLRQQPDRSGAVGNFADLNDALAGLSLSLTERLSVCNFDRTLRLKPASAKYRPQKDLPANDARSFHRRRAPHFFSMVRSPPPRPSMAGLAGSGAERCGLPTPIASGCRR